ncbi:MAG: leucine-rich repeat protein [Lachnospiraceae bacterium]|nr:leucine-rich repeat protein [Lachnospiraceae bacterium]
MAKKRRPRRLKAKIRRTICATMAAVFMISAVLVAAIPVQNVQADDETIEIGVSSKDSSIPQISPGGGTPIYTTGDGMFQFAYINRLNSSDKIAVIVGYVASRSLDGGVLTIPDTVNGYKKLTDTHGTDLGYVASSQDGTPLYYAIYKEVEVPTGNTITTPVYDDDGIQIGTVSSNEMTTEKQLEGYKPCFYSAEYRSQWEGLGSEEFFYKVDSTLPDSELNNFRATTTDDKKWVRDAEVAYISNQHVKSKTNENVKWDWVLDETPEVGVFSMAGNIITLKTGEKLLGIGDNAFRGCSSLQAIVLANGANTIGNYAFAECINLKTVDINLHSSVSKIGHHAFYNCRGLRSFTMPIFTSELGDSAFEGCSAMTEIALYGKDEAGDEYNVSLKKIGPHAFKGCTSLKGIDFPSSFYQENEDLDIGLVEGCNGLEYITINNDSLKFSETPGSSFGFQEFINQVSERFYFAGFGNSRIHDVATAEGIAFKYLDDPYLYEKVIEEINPNTGIGTGKHITYRVDEDNNLRYFNMEDGVENVEIPGAIGPYNITKIGSDSFQANCDLKKITIPSSITEIGASAFKGCHSLEDVIFEEPINLTDIGAGAFHTQDATCSHASSLTRNPKLTFTGTVSPYSKPFAYAMDPASNINRGTQEVTYITFYSGWPSNLTIRYNPEKDLNELVDYPTYESLRGGTISFPDTTPDQKMAARDAIKVYEDYKSGSSFVQPTQDQWDIVNSALNVKLPNGIEAIAAGLFSGKDEEGKDVSSVSGNSVRGVNNRIESIEMESVLSIPAYAFYGCEALQTVFTRSSGNEEGEYIGNYAFGNCDNLVNVNLSPNLQKFGLRPFKDCDKLTFVGFPESPYFICDNGIIFGTEDGVKTSIIECLETRGMTGDYAIGSSMIGKGELEGIKSIADEAFMDCVGIGDVDLSLSAIAEIPVSCFENTTTLFSVEIPETAKTIRERAFRNSAVRSLRIPSSVSFIDSTAFTNENGTVNKNITISCEEGSAAETFAKLYGLTLGEMIQPTFTVVFFDWDDTILKTQKVEKGSDAEPPVDPVRKGYTFVGWKGDYTSVARDMSIYAFYDRTDEDVAGTTYKVIFYDWDDEILDEQDVMDGKDAHTPPAPTREGYMFTGWRPGYSNVTSNLSIYAQYEKLDPEDTRITVNFYNYDGTLVSTQKVDKGGSAMAPADPTREGYTFTGWIPSYLNLTKDTDVYAQFEKSEVSGSSNNTSNSGSSSDNESNNGNDNNQGTYTVTVNGGSGSGNYRQGSTVTITAGTVAGRTFSGWTVNSGGVTLGSNTASSTTFIMPGNAVVITANFSNSGTSTATNSSSNRTVSGNTAGTVNKTSTGTGTKSGGNTTVDITKTGISNKGVASATVNGSSDNFIVKITDSEEARAAMEQALLAEYGNLDDIKFFAMDISLYDSTGTNRITNTAGLSVNITIPLPDALVEYAGNNKVASVLNGSLDKLSPRFTSINGVPCVSFVATHFSPYGIYVDTAHLTAGTTIDATPTTGDGIHPKWFLVIGLAALSILSLCMMDTKKKVIMKV